MAIDKLTKYESLAELLFDRAQEVLRAGLQQLQRACKPL